MLVRLAVAFVVAGCGSDRSAPPAPAPAQVDPIGHSTPEAQGIDSTSLAELVQRIVDDGLSVHSLTIVRHGNVVLDATFFPYDGKKPHDIASCTKSLTSTALGLAMQSGDIDSLGQSLVSFFPEHAIPEASAADERAITLAQAISMTSGFDCVTDPTELTLLDMQNAPDWVSFALDVPMAAAPGTQWRYCGTATHLLSAVITRATGKPEDELLATELFAPIGAHRPVWPRDPQGNSHGWGDARLLPDDLVRLGQLFLQRGTFGGKRLLDAAFVDEATSNRVGDLGPANGYGYGWWTTSRAAYYADGRGGQLLIIAPEFDALAVTTGGETSEQEQALQKLLSDDFASTLSDSALPENPDAVKRLDALVASVKQPPPSEPVPTEPATAASASGVRYPLPSNVLGWDAVTLAFEDTVATLTVEMGATTSSATIGLDAVPRITRAIQFATIPRYDELDIALGGRWLDERTFEATFDTIDTIDSGTIDFAFQGQALTITVLEKTFLLTPITIEAQAP